MGPGAEFPSTWCSSALADKRAGYDLAPGFADIRARFNSNLGNTGCLTGISWYYGLDAMHGTQIDLVAVLLHELAHGLGFQQFADVTTGAEIGGQTDVYGRHLLDTTTGLAWDQMTDAERVASAINSMRVVWNGPTVGAAVPGVLSLGTPLLNIDAPASLAGDYAVGIASFGPPLSSPGVSGDVVLVDDGVPPVTDGCSALAAGSLTGRIALIDRGTCTFVVKVKNAQNAGAKGVIIADNAAGAPPAGLGGTDPTITIPSVRITLADGNAIKAALLSNPVHATLGVDLAVLAGADPEGRALVYTPNPVQPGSTISHWDTIAFPNLLMEPAINADLTHSVMPPQDLTLPLLREIGWFADANLNGVPDGNECQITCPADQVISTDPGRCDAVFNYTVTASGICCGDLTGDPPSGATFPLGSTQVRVTAPSGASCSFAVTVVGCQPPGACCSRNAYCRILSPARCQALRGVFVGGACAPSTNPLCFVARSPRGGDTVPSDPAPSEVEDGPLFTTLSVRAAPTPFAGRTELIFTGPMTTEASLLIVDAAGRRVRSVWQGSLNGQTITMVWDGRDDSGREAPSGVYLAQLRSGSGSAVARVIKAR